MFLNFNLLADMTLHVSNNLEKFCLSVILNSCPFVPFIDICSLRFFLYILYICSQTNLIDIILAHILPVFLLLLALLMLLLLFSPPNFSGLLCHLLFGLLFKTSFSFALSIFSILCELKMDF